MHGCECARVCVEAKERERPRETQEDNEDEEEQKKMEHRGCVTFKLNSTLHSLFKEFFFCSLFLVWFTTTRKLYLSRARAPSCPGWWCVRHSPKSESNMETMSMVEICGTNRIKCGEFRVQPLRTTGPPD